MFPLVGRFRAVVAPEPVDTEPRRPPLRSTATRVVDWLWSTMHIEFQGFYSLEKLYAFQVSEPLCLWRHCVVLVVATLPTTTIVFGLELLPLEDPALGWTQNPTFFARQTLRAWTISIAANAQIQEVIPKLFHPWYRLLLIAFLQIVPFIGTLVTVATVFGAFPVPFSNLAPILPVFVVAVFIRYCFIRDVLQRNPELKPQHERLERLTGFTFTILLVYCAYGFAFRNVDWQSQIALSFGLYGIKLWVKQRMWTLSHVHDHHDLSAESTSCGSRLFHTLFLTACLQSARSYATFSIFLVLGSAQDAFAIRSLEEISSGVDAPKQIDWGTSPFDAEWTSRLLTTRDELVFGAGGQQNEFHDSPIMVRQSSYARHQLVISASKPDRGTLKCPSIAALGQIGGQTSKEAAAMTHAVANLLHCREVVLLRLFIDIFVPVFYFSYVAVATHLPNDNHLYLQNMSAVDNIALQQLGIQVLILVATKLVALFTICRLAVRRGHPLAIHQLAFIVRSQRWTMQPWFIVSVLQIVDFPLVHMGNDLTFQFKWIRR